MSDELTDPTPSPAPQETPERCAFPGCGCAKSEHYDDAAKGRGHCGGCCEPEDTDSHVVCVHRFRPSQQDGAPPSTPDDDPAVRAAEKIRATWDFNATFRHEATNIIRESYAPLLDAVRDLLAKIQPVGPRCFNCGLTSPEPDVFDGERYRHVGDCPSLIQQCADAAEVVAKEWAYCERDHVDEQVHDTVVRSWIKKSDDLRRQLDLKTMECSAGREENDRLQRQLAVRVAAVELVQFLADPKPNPDVVGGDYPSLLCPIYGGRRRGWTCLDEQKWASDENHPCGDDLRAALKSGQGLCLQCRARTLLASQPSGKPSAGRPTAQPGEPERCHKCGCKIGSDVTSCKCYEPSPQAAAPVECPVCRHSEPHDTLLDEDGERQNPTICYAPNCYCTVEFRDNALKAIEEAVLLERMGGTARFNKQHGELAERLSRECNEQLDYLRRQLEAAQDRNAQLVEALKEARAALQNAGIGCQCEGPHFVCTLHIIESALIDAIGPWTTKAALAANSAEGAKE